MRGPDGVHTLRHATSFRGLIVYQKARSAAALICECSKGFPREERYALTDQLRRSSRSIGAQIAEAWGKRRYQNHFISKLTDADAEQQETQHWLDTSADCAYLTREETAQIVLQLEEIGRMLDSMIAKAPQFCGSPADFVREEHAAYFSDRR